MSNWGVPSDHRRLSSRATGEEDGQLRAALLAIHLAVRNDMGNSGLPGLMSADQAIPILVRSRSRYQRRAIAFAGARLAVSYLKGNGAPSSRAERLLMGLGGPELVQSLRSLPNLDSMGAIMSAAYALAWDTAGLGVRQGSTSSSDGADGNFDPATLITTATVWKTARGDMRKLPAYLDPRAWCRSPFWLASERVERRDGRFVPYPDVLPLGTPWKGYLYEYVISNVDGGTQSGFQVYLNVDFSVSTNDHGVPTGVHFTYSLYQAAGNLLLVRVAPGGMEIDSGFGKTDVSAWKGDFADVKLTCAKSVRYTDILTRSTCGQGAQGAGNALNYDAPATLSMWMYELVSGNVQQWAADTMPSLGGQP